MNGVGLVGSGGVHLVLSALPPQLMQPRVEVPSVGPALCIDGFRGKVLWVMRHVASSL